MDQHTVDMLCFGAHPDDVEIGMAGTIHKHVRDGLKVGIVDLTKGELSSNGTVAGRQREAAQAADILGVEQRVNLGFPDRGLTVNDALLWKIVVLVRRFRPKVVCLPYAEDRHPDHRQTARIVEEAVFSANIRKYQREQDAVPPHRVEQMYYYFFNEVAKPDVIIDISEQMEIKKKALLAYASQFQAEAAEVETRLNTGFVEAIEARDQLFGKWVNVRYAEAFVVKQPLLLQQLILRKGV